MKKLIVTTLLVLSSTAVNANSLSIIDSTAITFSGYNGQPALYTGARSAGFLGAISADFAGTITATYLGNESGDNNRFRFEVGNSLNEMDSIGSTINRNIAAGIVDFRFRDTTTGGVFVNGSPNLAGATLSYAILDGILNPARSYTNYGPFDFLIGFNDNGSGDTDYDDFVVGLRFAPSEVPIPASIPLMASAIGLFAFGKRRGV